MPCHALPCRVQQVAQAFNSSRCLFTNKGELGFPFAWDCAQNKTYIRSKDVGVVLVEYPIYVPGWHWRDLNEPWYVEAEPG